MLTIFGSWYRLIERMCSRADGTGFSECLLTLLGGPRISVDSSELLRISLLVSCSSDGNRKGRSFFSFLDPHEEDIWCLGYSLTTLCLITTTA